MGGGREQRQLEKEQGEIGKKPTVRNGLTSAGQKCKYHFKRSSSGKIWGRFQRKDDLVEENKQWHDMLGSGL